MGSAESGYGFSIKMCRLWTSDYASQEASREEYPTDYQESNRVEITFDALP
jgi:hypothetical protein